MENEYPTENEQLNDNMGQTRIQVKIWTRWRGPECFCNFIHDKSELNEERKCQFIFGINYKSRNGGGGANDIV